MSWSGSPGLPPDGALDSVTVMTVASPAPVLEPIRGVADEAGRFTPVPCHGGPISAPSDFEQALQLVPRPNGFGGASSIERLLTEAAIVDRVARFGAVRR